MDWAYRELRQTLRALRRDAGLVVVVVLTLGLGIGGNATILGVIQATFFGRLPFPDSKSVLRLQTSYRKPDGTLSRVTIRGREFNVLQQTTTGEAGPFSGIVGLEDVDATLSGITAAERVTRIHCTPGWREALGVSVSLGRWFSSDEESRGSDSAVAVVAHEFWQRRFGGDEGALGKTISVDGRVYTVIGVMPPGFRFPYDAEVWTPVTTPWDLTRDYAVFARLKPGVTPERAQASLDAAARSVREKYADTAAGFGFVQSSLMSNLLENQQGAALALVGVAVFFLLLACANVANLLLARSFSREREQAIRTALGAPRWVLARGRLMESLVLSAGGTGVGLLLAGSLSGGLGLLVPSNLTRQLGIVPRGTEAHVILATAALGVLAGLFSGVLPALRSVRLEGLALVRYGVRTGRSRRERWIMDGFVVLQFTLALALLAGAGLEIREFDRLTRRELGIDASHLLVMQVSVTAPRYAEGQGKRRLIRELTAEVETAPGVVSAGVTTINPLGEASWWSPVIVEGQEEAAEGSTPLVNHRLITPGLCRTMGIPLRRGRYFTEQDNENAPRVVLVSERTARRFWGQSDPIGKRMRINRPGQPWLTVVGVVGDVLDSRDPSFPKETWYLPYAQFADSAAASSVFLMVRASADPRSVQGGAERAVRRVDPNLAVFGESTMDAFYLQSLAQNRLSTILIGLLASFGLLLGALGIYGALSFAVGERRREIGIRMALGATPGVVLRLVLQQGMRISLVAALLGLGAAWAMGRVLASQLSQVSPADPLVMASAAGVLLCAATLAIVLPARRAADVDPVAALSQE